MMGEQLLTAREVGALLGVSASTVLDKFEAGILPGFKLWNGPVRFRLSEVEGCLENWRRGPAPSRGVVEVV